MGVLKVIKKDSKGNIISEQTTDLSKNVTVDIAGNRKKKNPK